MKKNKVMTLTLLLINIILFIGLIILPIIVIEYVNIVRPLQFVFCIVLFFAPSYVAIFSYFITKKSHISIKIILFILNVFSFVFCFITAAFINLDNLIISETTNINDYLVFDKYLRKYETSKIFPEQISTSAKNVKYFYRYRHSLDVDYEIYLEMTLPKEEYDKEKTRIENYSNLEIMDVDYYKNRINYMFDYDYININDVTRSYSVHLVSFSDEDLSIRYVIAFAMDPIKGEIPYFLLQE